jgi:hypothetical protein
MGLSSLHLVEEAFDRIFVDNAIRGGFETSKGRGNEVAFIIVKAVIPDPWRGPSLQSRMRLRFFVRFAQPEL